MKVLSKAGDTMDLICWRHLGQYELVTEQALDLNRSAAFEGPILPEGIEITLPDVPANSVATREYVQLWSQ